MSEYTGCAIRWVALSAAICVAIYMTGSAWPLAAFVFAPYIHDDKKQNPVSEDEA